MMRAAAVLAVLAAASALPAQQLEIHSEFLRVDPHGEILSIDRTPEPREILSPALARNAFFSFHVVVRSPRINYFLFAGANPENAVKTAVYQEEFARHGADWVPDALRPVELPHFAVIPDPQSEAPEQSARAYLVEVWVPADAPVGRMRLEIQVKAGGWTVWPMELRILPAVVPSARVRSPQRLPAAELRADEAAMAPLLEYLGRHGEGPGTAKPAMSAAPTGPPRSLREVIRRNAEQDMALARTLDPAALVPALNAKLATVGGGEWYLGVRDLLYRMASEGR